MHVVEGRTEHDKQAVIVFSGTNRGNAIDLHVSSEILCVKEVEAWGTGCAIQLDTAGLENRAWT